MNENDPVAKLRHDIEWLENYGAKTERVKRIISRKKLELIAKEQQAKRFK